MAKKQDNSQLPSSIFVRMVASVMIALAVLVIFATITSLQTFGWFSVLILIVAAISLFMSTMAIKTGKPEWLLLDLIWPS